MSESEIEYGAVLRSVDRFLRRYRDPFTRAHREDLAQEAVIETWRRGESLRDPSRAAAFARTVARRLRFQAAQRAARAARAQRVEIAFGDTDESDLVDRRGTDRTFWIDGRWVDVDWLSEQLDEVVEGLGPLNAPIVRGYYQGASCRELGERYGLPTAGVKARIHRSRLRIRRSFAERARCAPRTDDAAGGPRRSHQKEGRGEDT